MRNGYLLIGLALTLMSFGIISGNWNIVKREEIEIATKKINSFYSEHVSFSVNVSHKTYKGHHATTAYDESNGYLKRKGNLYHSFMLGVHSYQDEVVSFTVDTATRAILIADKKDAEVNKDIKIETLIAQNNVIAYKKIADGTGLAYRVDYNKNHPFEATEMHLNPNHSLKEIVMYMSRELPVTNDQYGPKAKAKAKIIYSDYNLSPVFKTNEFSHKTYFVFKNGKVLKNKNYDNYKIIDNRIDRKQKDDM